MKYFNLILITALFSVPFTNCSNFSEPVKETDLVLLSHCEDECENLTEYKVANDENENLDVRQTVESYLSLLGMKVSSLSAGNLTSINSEKKRRQALLAQESDISKLNSINMLSQTSLAGEVCRTFVTTDGLKSPLFSGVTFSMKPNQIPLNNWMNVVHNFAMQAWSRPMTGAEADAFKSFLQDSLTESTRSPNAEKLTGTNSLETINLGIMICTTVLASPEATSM